MRLFPLLWFLQTCVFHRSLGKQVDGRCHVFLPFTSLSGTPSSVNYFSILFIFLFEPFSCRVLIAIPLLLLVASVVRVMTAFRIVWDWVLLSNSSHRALAFLLMLTSLLRPNLLLHLKVFPSNLPLLKDFCTFFPSFTFLFSFLLLYAFLAFKLSKTASSEGLPDNPCCVHKQLVLLLLFPPIWKTCMGHLMTPLLTITFCIGRYVTVSPVVAELCIYFFDCSLL